MEQYQSLFYNSPANANNSFAFSINEGIAFGNIIITTTDQFNGTTSGLNLMGSNDGRNYAQVYQDNNTAPMTFVLTTNNQYTWYFRRFLFKYYRVDYTLGDATFGNYTANFLGKDE